MKNQQWGLSPIFISLTAVAGLIIVGSVIYFYNKDQSDKVATPASTESANQSRAESGFAGFSNSRGQASYLMAKLVIETKADILFNQATTDQPEIKLKSIPVSLKNNINAKRQKITTLLNDWEKLVTQTSFNLNLTDTSTQNLAIINSYLNDLSNIVDNLTPDNSGLTPAEIDHYQEVITDAQTDIQEELSPEEETEYDPPLDQSLFDSSGEPRLIEGSNQN